MGDTASVDAAIKDRQEKPEDTGMNSGDSSTGTGMELHENEAVAKSKGTKMASEGNDSTQLKKKQKAKKKHLPLKGIFSIPSGLKRIQGTPRGPYDWMQRVREGGFPPFDEEEKRKRLEMYKEETGGLGGLPIAK